MASLRSVLLDPAVNILFQKLKAELQATKARLEDTQNELSAWKFTPDSNTGKRLMAKCRLLYQENEELGKMTSNGRLAKLEGDLALQKSFSEEVKKSQSGKLSGIFGTGPTRWLAKPNLIQKLNFLHLIWQNWTIFYRN